jgi:hypothetical protein
MPESALSAALIQIMLFKRSYRGNNRDLVGDYCMVDRAGSNAGIDTRKACFILHRRHLILQCAIRQVEEEDWSPLFRYSRRNPGLRLHQGHLKNCGAFQKPALAPRSPATVNGANAANANFRFMLLSLELRFSDRFRPDLSMREVNRKNPSH